MEDYEVVKSSFRDPSGVLFYYNNEIYRQVNHSYKDNYNKLVNSGLYDKLVNKDLLTPHIEVDISPLNPDIVYKIIKPEKIQFISYPYEWCFSQLKNAALRTLEIQKISLDYGMTLKDASAYNIQFKNSKAVLIDTLSFERYREGQFWTPYKQFCQHFLAPLSLMSYRDIRLNQLLRIHLDGIPLDLTSKLLPVKTKAMFSLMSHIHAHAKSQKHYEKKFDEKIKEKKLGYKSFLGIIDSLHSAVKKINWEPKGTEWADYYTEINYSKTSFQQKKESIEKFFDSIEKPNLVWDLGANTGFFSRIASSRGIETISFDIDPAAVEKNFLNILDKNETNLLPLILDLTNPSSGIGWDNNERMSILERGPADVVLALALIHHLVISNNLPLEKIAKFFKKNCRFLIIEYVPKLDSQVQKLLSAREDIFDSYTEQNFVREFEKSFLIKNSIKLQDSERTLYFMEKKV